MADSCTHVYVHYVWRTWDSRPLISVELEKAIYLCIARKCEELRCSLVEIGGTEDHVHVLVRLHSLVSVADLAHGMKGASSHLITHVIAPGSSFKWQGTYGAFSVGEQHVEAVRQYIRNQKAHHTNNDLRPEWERTVEPAIR
jgi:putative transposase